MDRIKVVIYIALLYVVFNAGQATSAPNLPLWEFIKDCAGIASGFGTAGAAYFGYQALKTWRWQINHQFIYDTSICLEKNLLEFLVLSVGEKKIEKDPEIINMTNAIKISRFQLQQRGGDGEVLDHIETSMRAAIREMADKDYVTEKSHGNLLAAANQLSSLINDMFE
ncbi:hypothetical protein L4D76_01825 [Photobacterium sagamiensis]|uniref:hypothetical protein n=1 Tax=Photobacterium sagamiensis TaxID=2910241 RepID=UPI003D0A29F6